MNSGPPTRPVWRHYGGKFRLAAWVVEHLPAHIAYTEVFCGAASVFMRKPRAHHEVLNDLDDEVTLIFRLLRDRDTAAALKELLRYTPFARTEFEAAYEPTAEPLEKARRFLIRSFMGYATHGHNAGARTGFRAYGRGEDKGPAVDWQHYADALDTFTERLQGVTIESRPALEVLAQQDHAEALHYEDPPYVEETRRKGSMGNYRHEMTDADHRQLAEVNHSLKGMVVISGYPGPLYEELYAGWQRVTREAYAHGALPRTEALWLNPRAWDALQRARQGTATPQGALSLFAPDPPTEPEDTLDGRPLKVPIPQQWGQEGPWPGEMLSERSE